MKGSAKLKDQARGHEQREEWEAAIDIYIRVLQDSDDRDVADLPLYNRVGDLYLRLGRSDDAVRYYEQAAAEYAESELYNNAIALCNKALRYAPSRLDLLRRLGVYSASQGFLTDARHWFLEFAERAFRKGEMDAAFGALEEFARISEEAEIRELLARKLHTHGREAEAATEFRRAYKMRVRAGEFDAAAALRQEVLELEPGTDLGVTSEAADESDSAQGRSAEFGLPTVGEDADGVLTARGLPGLEPTHRGQPAANQNAPPAQLDGFERTSLASDETSAEPGDDHGTDDEDTVDSEPIAETEDETAAAGDDEVEDESPLESLPLLPGYAATATPAETDEQVAPDGWPAPIPDVRDDRPWEPAAMPVEAAGPAPWVDLSDLFGVNEPHQEETRFFVEETDPSGDEDRDFAELLAQFKQKLSEHIAHDDVGSHYDLGLAFKEMGLLDEAVNQFQTALRAGSTDRLKIYEELGHCFLMKEQYNIAAKVLSRALQFDHKDDIELIGVYYLLGRAHEEMRHNGEAVDAYERVLGLDIGFKDVAQRMARL